MPSPSNPFSAPGHPVDTPRLAAGQTNRREFLRLLGLGFLASYTTVSLDAAGAAVVSGRQTDPFGVRAVDDVGTTFPQSVASGDPTSSGMILWTRLLPTAVTGVDPLALEVALDAAFTQLQLRVNIPAGQVTATLDYTVRVDLDRHLHPNTIYYYRFIYQNVSSRTGRARTLPLANDATVSSLKFAVLNCQDYTNGYYGAFAAMAQDTTIDYVLHVGDFIYETTGGTEFQSEPYPERNIILPIDPSSQAALGLADYRFLYQTYRSDPALRDTLENFTWMVMWDDHEMANDQYHDYTDTEYPNGSQGAPDHPYTTSPQDYDGGAYTSAQLLHQLKLDSQQAWFEYTAVRAHFNQSSADIFGRLQIYRNFRFGTLVEFFLTDERNYRSSHPDGESVPNVPSGFGARYLAPTSPPLVGQNDPGRTMLGDTQRAAFVQSVSTSGAQWKAWANEVLLSQLQVQVTPALLSVLPAALSQLLGQLRHGGQRFLGWLRLRAHANQHGVARRGRAEPRGAHRRFAHLLGQLCEGRLHQRQQHERCRPAGQRHWRRVHDTCHYVIQLTGAARAECAGRSWSGAERVGGQPAPAISQQPPVRVRHGGVYPRLLRLHDVRRRQDHAQPGSGRDRQAVLHASGSAADHRHHAGHERSPTHQSDAPAGRGRASCGWLSRSRQPGDVRGAQICVRSL